MTTTPYKARSARDAAAIGYGTESYWEYLDRSAAETAEFFRKRGDNAKADEMLTRTLSEALAGNDGN